jgi:hypothetical protein
LVLHGGLGSITRLKVGLTAKPIGKVTSHRPGACASPGDGSQREYISQSST